MARKIIPELPQRLTLIKRGVQTFPGNQKVALYFCTELNKYFSFVQNAQNLEIMESDYSIIEDLKGIESVEELYFSDGTSLNIDNECAGYILNLYNTLSEGIEEFQEYISTSDKNFLKVLEFSIKNRE